MVKEDYFEWSKEELIREITKLKKRKKFGMVWEDKPEEVAELCKTKLPVIIEDKEKAISTDPEKPVNIFIEGDNYHALSVLNYTHKGAIDVIYIDPPYNTGARDWKYNNNYVDNNDAWRHSKWLSLIEKRLVLSKRLLKKDGVIIIAIDDNEVHRLRVLIDELMLGYATTSVTVVHNPRGNITNNFARTHEYALFIIPNGAHVIARTKKMNDKPRKFRRWGHNSTRAARPTMFYPVYVKDGQITRIGETPEPDFHPKSKNVIKENGEIEVWPVDQDGVERRWNFGHDTVNNELERMVAVEVKGEFDIFLTQEDSTPKTVWTDSEFEAGRNGATLVKTITGLDFPFPKSLYNVKRCLELIIGNRPNATVLDFFAGSGTTGHAVLELNKDGGKRKFILCTNNESNIASEICYPRVANVINGYKDQKGNKIEGLGGNLRYFKTAFVDAEATDMNKRKLVDNSTEMLCVKEACFDNVESTEYFKIFKNSEDKYIGIIYDDDGISPFIDELKKTQKKFVVYVFSLDDSAREEEFEEVKDLVELKAIPAVILNIYKRIFK
jgi:adenine-specific DNA-methyltransferase